VGIFDNLVSLKVGASFTVEEGIEVIGECIKKYNPIDMINVPDFIVQKFFSLLTDKDVTLYHENVAEAPEEYEKLFDVRISEVNIKSDYLEKHANLCIINLARKRSFNIVYADNKIYDIGEVCVAKCLKCIGRNNIYSSHETISFGSVRTIADGISQVMKFFEKSSNIIVHDLPDPMLSDVLDVLREVSINAKILAHSETSLKKELKKFPRAKILPSYINTKFIHQGIEARTGGVAMDEINFALPWSDGKILEVRTVEWSKCVECMFNMYNAEWIISKKVR